LHRVRRGLSFRPPRPPVELCGQPPPLFSRSHFHGGVVVGPAGEAGRAAATPAQRSRLPRGRHG
jgi:hypothetical protein